LISNQLEEQDWSIRGISLSQYTLL